MKHKNLMTNDENISIIWIAKTYNQVVHVSGNDNILILQFEKIEKKIISTSLVLLEPESEFQSEF